MRSIGRAGVLLLSLSAGVAFAQDSGSGNVTIFDTTPSQPKPVVAPARGIAAHGFEVGLRLGYALASGEVASGEALSDQVGGALPAQLDLGYRFNPRWFAGVYAQYGLFLTKSCPQGSSCSGYDARFGIEGQWHFLDQSAYDPWLGLGVGYEVGHTSVSGAAFPGDETNAGFEFVNLAAGGDYRVAPRFAVGPVISMSVAEYSKFSINGTTVDATNVSKSLHALFSFGVRGVFDLM